MLPLDSKVAPWLTSSLMPIRKPNCCDGSSNHSLNAVETSTTNNSSSSTNLKSAMSIVFELPCQSWPTAQSGLLFTRSKNCPTVPQRRVAASTFPCLLLTIFNAIQAVSGLVPSHLLLAATRPRNLRNISTEAPSLCFLTNNLDGPRGAVFPGIGHWPHVTGEEALEFAWHFPTVRLSEDGNLVATAWNFSMEPTVRDIDADIDKAITYRLFLQHARLLWSVTAMGTAIYL